MTCPPSWAQRIAPLPSIAAGPSAPRPPSAPSSLLDFAVSGADSTRVNDFRAPFCMGLSEIRSPERGGPPTVVRGVTTSSDSRRRGRNTRSSGSTDAAAAHATIQRSIATVDRTATPRLPGTSPGAKTGRVGASGAGATTGRVGASGVTVSAVGAPSVAAAAAASGKTGARGRETSGRGPPDRCDQVARVRPPVREAPRPRDGGRETSVSAMKGRPARSASRWANPSTCPISCMTAVRRSIRGADPRRLGDRPAPAGGGGVDGDGPAEGFAEQQPVEVGDREPDAGEVCAGLEAQPGEPSPGRPTSRQLAGREPRRGCRVGRRCGGCGQRRSVVVHDGHGRGAAADGRVGRAAQADGERLVGFLRPVAIHGHRDRLRGHARREGERAGRCPRSRSPRWRTHWLSPSRPRPCSRSVPTGSRSG